MTLTQVLCNRTKPLQIVGVGSVFEAAIAVKHGADGIWLSSLCLSVNDVLPDEDLMSVERITREIVTLRRLFDGPILIDGGLGGSLPRLTLLLRACETSGASALCVEDARAPKRNSLSGCHSGLRDSRRFCERLRLMTRVRTDCRLSLIARTEGLLAGLSVEETVERSEQYAEVGIDALFVHANNRTDILKFAQRWRNRIPLLVCPTRFPELSIAEAEDHGISMILYANHGTRACYKALDETFAALLQGGSAGIIEPSIAPFDALLALTASQPLGRVDSEYIAQTLAAADAADGVLADEEDVSEVVARV